MINPNDNTNNDSLLMDGIFFIVGLIMSLIFSV